MNSNQPDQVCAQAVLSVILDGRHKDSFPKAAEIIDQPDALTDRTHRIVWLACQLLSDRGEEINSTSVATELSQIKYADAADAISPGRRAYHVRIEAQTQGIDFEDTALAAIGGYNSVSDIMLSTGHASSLEANCHKIMDFHKRRAVENILSESMKLLSGPDGTKKLNDIAEGAINLISTAIGNGKSTKDLGSALEQAGIAHDKAQEDTQGNDAKWGVHALDQAIQLDPARLIFLAAPRSCGKTSLALQSVIATAKEYGRGSVAVVSLEMPAVDLATIIAGREIGVNASVIRKGGLTKSQRARLTEIAEAHKVERSIAIKDAAFATDINSIAAWARQSQAISGGRFRLLVVDHLQALSSTNQKHTEYHRICDATGKLKSLAIELQICVLCLSQLSREGSKQHRASTGELSEQIPEPQMTDLRGSGSIEQDADGVVMLWPHQGLADATVPVTAKVAKNRFGPNARIELQWARTDGQVFSHYAPERRKPMDDQSRYDKAERLAREIV